jgi:hypothetical protein
VPAADAGSSNGGVAPSDSKTQPCSRTGRVGEPLLGVHRGDSRRRSAACGSVATSNPRAGGCSCGHSAVLPVVVAILANQRRSCFGCRADRSLRSWSWGAVRLRRRVGTSLGHGPPDSSGHERIPAVCSTLRSTCAKTPGPAVLVELEVLSHGRDHGPREPQMGPSLAKRAARKPVERLRPRPFDSPVARWVALVSSWGCPVPDT